MDWSDLQRHSVACILASTLVSPARVCNLQYRQNGTNFSAAQLRIIFNAALPTNYDVTFPDQRWTTYLLVHAHPDKGSVAITLGSAHG